MGYHRLFKTRGLEPFEPSMALNFPDNTISLIWFEEVEGELIAPFPSCGVVMWPLKGVPTLFGGAYSRYLDVKPTI